MSRNEDTNYTICAQHVRSSVYDCGSCDEELLWVLEERRLAKEYLQYLAYSILGGVFLNVIILTLLGAIPRYSSILVPVLAILSLAAGLLLLMATRFIPATVGEPVTSSSDRDSLDNN